MSYQNYLTNDAVSKYNSFISNTESINVPLDKGQREILNRFIYASKIPLNTKPGNNINLKDLQKVFTDFNNEFNKSKTFEAVIKEMDRVSSVQLIIDNMQIEIFFLSDNDGRDFSLESTIIYAIHIFFHSFPIKKYYNGLKIYVSLDNLRRDASYPISLDKINGGPGTFNYTDKHTKLDNIFDYLRFNGTAFNVSGLTDFNNKTIILTKKEEVVKLLFHELVHFAGLDSKLSDKKIEVDWPIKNQILSPSEAFTEFMSVIMHCAFSTLYIYAYIEGNIFEIYQNILSSELAYSIYLVGNLLKFYATDINFFYSKKGQEKIYSPILIWEYIILRTQLLFDQTRVFECLDDNFNVRNVEKIMKLMIPIKSLISLVENSMNSYRKSDNMSYLLIDIDWSKF